MNARSLKPGATLAELILVLSLLTAAAGIALPRLAHARDEYAVRGARDATAALVDRARTLAQLRGSARLRIDPAGAEIRIEAPIGNSAGKSLFTRSDWGADVTIAGRGSTAALDLDFDGRGLGRLANRTLRFRRGGREARLTLSSYGRVRRW